MSSIPQDPVIRVENLTAGYGGNTILEGVSFTVNRGEILCIVGRSGCGKSTLLKQMIGLYKPFHGRVLINGIDIHAVGEHELRHVRTGFGVLFQSGSLFGSMTLEENVALPIHEYSDLPPDLVALIVKMKLGLVNLVGYEAYLPSELSGGMKKIAGLARAMALDPDILFFDEPSTGLDPVTSAELDRTIRNINEGMGTTMVIVSHELASILNIAHRIVVLDEDAKGIIAEGDPKGLLDRTTDRRVRNFLTRQVSKD